MKPRLRKVGHQWLCADKFGGPIQWPNQVVPYEGRLGVGPDPWTAYYDWVFRDEKVSWMRRLMGALLP